MNKMNLEIGTPPVDEDAIALEGVFEEARIERLSPVFGASITGVDLSRPLTAEQQVWFRNFLTRYKVIAIRDQDIGHEALERFASYFGEPYTHPMAAAVGQTSAVNELRADEKSTAAFGETWHADMTSEESPPTVTMLRLAVLPPHGGGDTLFADTVTAYERLSAPLKAFLGGLTARHNSGIFSEKYGASGNLPEAIHPVIKNHPISGLPTLFVNTRFTKSIVELGQGESRAVLEYLFHYIAETPDFQLRFRWSKDTLLVWDNRSTQHCAIFDYWPHTRVGYRVTLYEPKTA
ncbi:TauD/TfdA family dioxygenase [Erythrobacter sp. NFXS35]|uniref:TauD/TfdA dioxygenase family protein n=1 Tax=Erythrobacter sp. NFXS35 TaxID=2818436 RepID=UPI0032DF60D9